MSSPKLSWCRHCGEAGEMTGEHVPPRSTGNDQPVGRFDDPFDLNAIVQQVAEWDEGHVVDTPDRRCNGRASDWKYVQEYRRWHDLFVERAREIVAKTNEDPLRGEEPFEIELPYNANPARFVRQVVGMFLAVQETEHLFAAYQALPDLIGPDPADDSKRRVEGLSIAPLKLYLSVCHANWNYLTQPMFSVEMPLGARSELVWTPPAVNGRAPPCGVLSPLRLTIRVRPDNPVGGQPWS